MAQSPYPFFETLLLSDGLALHAAWHLHRMRRTLEAQGADSTAVLSQVETRLGAAFETNAPTAKLRLEYGKDGYTTHLSPPPTGPYSTLQLLTVQHLIYPCKRTDRRSLEAAHAQRGEADDVLLIIDGNVTDTTIANLMLLRQGEWFTPSDSLLPGTKQARYIAEQGLAPVQIPLRHLERYERIVAINALRDAEISHIA